MESSSRRTHRELLSRTKRKSPRTRKRAEDFNVATPTRHRAGAILLGRIDLLCQRVFHAHDHCGGAYVSALDVIAPTVTVTFPTTAELGTRTCNCVLPACRTVALTVPPLAAVNFTRLFAGVTTSNPAPS